jgi:hypothetical protein
MGNEPRRLCPLGDHVSKLCSVQTSIYLNFKASRDGRRDQDEIVRYLSKLSYADGATFNSRSRENEPHCLPDTRTDLLRQVIEWGTNHRDNCIFWLDGMAGTGKSTIARTVARTFYDQGRLGASFFFSRGRGDLAKTDKFFPTLAIQLAKVSSYLRRYICEAIAENEDIGQQVLHDQWKQLVLRPLSRLKDDQISSSPLILVIDALDECENQKDIRIILQLLAQAIDLEAVQLRVFVTSRPEIPILLGFGDIPGIYRDFVLQNIPRSVVEHDISVLIQHELDDIREKCFLPGKWPGQRQLDILVQRAGSLFIYASTVCRFIGGSRCPDQRLGLVIGEAILDQPPQKPCQVPTSMLDDMYSKILTHSVLDCTKGDVLKLSRLFKQIVGCIIILDDVLSVIALSQLLSIETESIMSILGCLCSVLDLPRDQNSPLRLLHPSFREYLLDEKRCLNGLFKVNESEAQSALAESCLKFMSKTLRRDICGLKMPGALTSELQNEIIAKYLHTQSNANDGFEKNNMPFRGNGGEKYYENEDKKGRNQLHDNGDGDGDGGNDPDQAQANSPRGKIDPKTFYGYLFDQDKKPSKVLDAILRGIAKYIVRSLMVKFHKRGTDSRPTER